jgi:hypothetical protein
MLIRYYVVPSSDRYALMREGKVQGSHPTRQRALDAAVFMATIEANKLGHTGEIFAEDFAGRMLQQLVIGPREAESDAEHALVLRRIGSEQVRVAS